jgi:hypothetical protein
MFGAGSAAVIAGAALMLSAPAQAYVVCNDQGDCWHASQRYDVPQAHVTFYDDSWDWKSHNYRWHDADDAPGYWDSQENKWVTVKKTTTTTTTTTSTPPPQ